MSVCKQWWMFITFWVSILLFPSPFLLQLHHANQKDLLEPVWFSHLIWLLHFPNKPDPRQFRLDWSPLCWYSTPEPPGSMCSAPSCSHCTPITELPDIKRTLLWSMPMTTITDHITITKNSDQEDINNFHCRVVHREQSTAQIYHSLAKPSSWLLISEELRKRHFQSLAS